MDLSKLFGNLSATNALLFISRYEEATVSEISKVFKAPKTQIYNQLIKLEDAGIISSRELGNLRIYFFNPRLVIKNELRSLLEKYIETNLPMETNKDFYLIRRRSRSRGKPLRGTYAKNNN